MKKILLIALISVGIVACKNEGKKTEKVEEVAISYTSYGEKISVDGALKMTDVLAKYQDLKVGDTINLKFASNINDVCSKKGCWMKLPVGETEEVMVRFKDYGFFMPLDSKGNEVIVAGKAFVKETSVEDLKHYAEDAGKSAEEIAKITEPKKTLSFEAHGVLMKK